MRLTPIASLLICATLHAGAGTLKGTVLKNEIGGPPVPAVEVTSQGANPTKTGGDGQFRLDFPAKNPGDTVRVAINQRGYVVVNAIELELGRVHTI